MPRSRFDRRASPNPASFLPLLLPGARRSRRSSRTRLNKDSSRRCGVTVEGKKKMNQAAAAAQAAAGRWRVDRANIASSGWRAGLVGVRSGSLVRLHLRSQFLPRLCSSFRWHALLSLLDCGAATAAAAAAVTAAAAAGGGPSDYSDYHAKRIDRSRDSLI